MIIFEKILKIVTGEYVLYVIRHCVYSNFVECLSENAGAIMLAIKQYWLSENQWLFIVVLCTGRSSCRALAYISLLL